MKRLIAPLLTGLIGTLVFCMAMFGGFEAIGELFTDEEIEGRHQFIQFDNRLYDTLLRIKPAIEEEEILFLVMDDATITKLDMYPLSRDITADGLILLKEFNPTWTMIDIEYVDGSPMGVDLDYLDYELPEELRESYDFLIQNYSQLITNILSGSIDRDGAIDYMEQLTQMGQEESDLLYSIIAGNVAVDRDARLGEAVGYMDEISVTLNVTENSSESLTDEERESAAANYSVTGKLDLNGRKDPFPTDLDILPSIPQVIDPAAWAGFPRMHVDKDGVRRRIDILYRAESDDNYYTHMGFGTWWIRQGDGTLAGAPDIIRTSRGVRIGDNDIPLDSEGALLINYPKRKFSGEPLNRREAEEWSEEDSTHLLSFYKLYHHDVLWQDVINLVSYLEYLGYGAWNTGYADRELTEFNDDLEASLLMMLSSGDGSGASDYGLYRDQFLELVQEYVDSGILDDLIYSIEGALSEPGLPDDMFAMYSEDLVTLPGLFEDISWRVEDLLTIRDELRNQIAGKLVVVGYTGSSTTDIGATPFQSQYMNVGIYGAVYNTLRQIEFLSVSPWWLSTIIVLLSSLALALVGLVAQKNSGLNTTLGVLLMLAIWAGAALSFIYGDFYIHMLPLILVTLLTLIASLVANYFTATKQRAEIQGIFGKFISPVVVDILSDNPNLMETSGDQRDITALFTDIEGFSTITEHLGSSVKVFEFLERYLAPMCDIILDERGTIDKFEGDAIIAFWNAPLDQDRHQFHACHAVMRMIEKEKELCEEFKADGTLDESVFEKIRKRNPDSAGRMFTRFGLNSGENNVGFIGTSDRKDYTALGDEMNLAARLEGANKLYGTQVLITQEVYDVVRDEFFTRRMDKVRVVGREKPVSLHQLAYSKDIGGFSTEERQMYVHYQKGLDFFYDKKWDESEKEFQKALKLVPGDKPSKVFIERCAAYRKNPPPRNWDGVYTMTSKK